MLETRHLRKVYKPKKGVPVEALRDVSLKFPDRGMVFLLGRSGSGKSTLLNLLGGLDRYDGGEIIIMGVSSKDFKQQHFDSYRNTYVGFIFQEYNVLEEFSVGANIALAIELQGRRATDEDINRILTQVDLAGYGNRKPNELSGGQKQRVAIARALVKNPEIIMADEPTGALDSNTGRQVLDTLKRLSADKLVLVVSHDREFAERYADRIIELADGAVVNDVEYLENDTAPAEETAALAYGDRSITVPADYRLTEEDRLAINAYLDALGDSDLVLQVGEPRTPRRATPTDRNRIAHRTWETFRLIKSKLPIKNAFKIGASGLKHKKIRLAVTILLSCVAFGLFGLADTFGAYDHVQTCTNSLIDSNITYASVQKTVRMGEGDNVYYTNNGAQISEAELDAIAKESGVSMNGVYEPFGWDMGIYRHFDGDAAFTETDFNIHAFAFSGLSEISTARLETLGYTLMAGRLPDGGKDEIAISRYVCESFLVGGYTDGTVDESGKAVYQKITAPEQMVGKTLVLGEREFTVVGVVDTQFDLERYRTLTVEKEDASNADDIVQYVLYRELMSAQSYSLNQVAMVGEGYVSALKASMPTVQEISGGWLWFSASGEGGAYGSIDPMYLGTLADVPPADIVWLDGERTTLSEKELVVSADCLYTETSYGVMTGQEEITAEMLAEVGSFTAEKMLYSDHEYREGENGYTVVGYLPQISQTVLGSDALCDGLIERDDGVYAFAVGGMPTARDEVQALVSYCYREDAATRYEMMNPVTYELDAVNEVLQELSRYFLYIGLGFALFAALMLANFISTSIAYKKQEIGILRAIGSRGNDVFRIFFAESFIIAMINFVLSAAAVGIATAVINDLVRSELGVLITVLTFGARQVVLLFAVSLLVAALASFFPVKRIASKRPIDAIRNR